MLNAQKKDAKDILPLIQEYFSYTEIDENELTRRLGDATFVYHIAREDTNFKGYAEWEIIDTKNKTIRLNGIATQKEFQGKGVAHSLMQAGEKTARKKGIKKMVLLVASTNHAAKELYAKNGWNFSRTHIKKINGEKTEVWEKELR